MRLAIAVAVTVLALLPPTAGARAGSGRVNTRFDAGVAWFLDKPPADEPVYPGFHGMLSADGELYRRLHFEVAGSIDAYRYGPDQIRSALFVVRAGPVFMPIDFDGGTGFIEATAGWARLHSRDCLALAGGIGYMAQYGRLGLGLFSRYQQVLVPEGWGHDLKTLIFGISAGVALIQNPRAAGEAPTDSDGDGVEDSKDRCPGTPSGAHVDSEGCEVKAGEVSPEKNPEPPAKAAMLREQVMADAPLSLDSAKVVESAAPAAPVEATSDDIDQDGVPNAADQCPSTTPGFPVDVTGCPVLRDRFALPQVLFVPFTARPRKEAFAQLDELAVMLRERPGARLKITGYVDSSKDKPLRVLKRVAKQRAVVVAELLAARGIAAKRMKAVGGDKPDIDEIEFQVSGSTKVVKPKPPKGPKAPPAAPPAPPANLNPPPASAPAATTNPPPAAEPPPVTPPKSAEPKAAEPSPAAPAASPAAPP